MLTRLECADKEVAISSGLFAVADSAIPGLDSVLDCSDPLTAFTSAAGAGSVAGVFGADIVSKGSAPVEDASADELTAFASSVSCFSVSLPCGTDFLSLAWAATTSGVLFATVISGLDSVLGCSERLIGASSEAEVFGVGIVGGFGILDWGRFLIACSAKIHMHVLLHAKPQPTIIHLQCQALGSIV
jgi:hypothetical protein